MLGELGSPRRIVRRHHRIVGGQAPLLSLLAAYRVALAHAPRARRPRVVAGRRRRVGAGEAAARRDADARIGASASVEAVAGGGEVSVGGGDRRSGGRHPQLRQRLLRPITRSTCSRKRSLANAERVGEVFAPRSPAAFCQPRLHSVQLLSARTTAPTKRPMIPEARNPPIAPTKITTMRTLALRPSSTGLRMLSIRPTKMLQIKKNGGGEGRAFRALVGAGALVALPSRRVRAKAAIAMSSSLLLLSDDLVLDAVIDI